MKMANVAIKQNKGERLVKRKRLYLDRTIHIFCFLSVLFIGADCFSIDVGITLRFDQLLLVIFTVLLLLKGKVFFKNNIYIVGFLIFSGLSTIFAYNFSRAALFYFSIVYNVVFIFYAFSSYIAIYGMNRFIRILRQTFYLQAVLLFIQAFLMIAFHYELPFLPSYGNYLGVYRFQLWFYEPSYLATHLSFWFALSFIMFFIGREKSYILDLLVCLAMIIISTSTSGFIAVALVVVFGYLIWLGRGITLRKLGWLVAFSAIAVVIYFAFQDTFDVFVGRIFTSSLSSASGIRIEHWAETWKVFSENPFFGVGPGCYGLYLGEEAGYVPTNVTLDLLSTVGIFGTVAFYGLTLSLVGRCIKAYKKEHNSLTCLMYACAFGLIIFTIVLQINQGYLRLYHWMFFGVLFGGLRRSNMQRRHFTNRIKRTESGYEKFA